MFNPLSGDTHILDIAAGEVLKVIMGGDGQRPHLCDYIAEFLNLPNDSELEKNVGDILASLDELGLIEPVTGC